MAGTTIAMRTLGRSCACLLALSCGCDVSESGSEPTQDTATSSGGEADTDETGPAADASSDGVDGCMDLPPSQQASEPCCPDHGPDACGALLFCAAFDGRTQPTCYPERSRLDLDECGEDVHCASGLCNQEVLQCASLPGAVCDARVGCADDPQGACYGCDTLRATPVCTSVAAYAGMFAGTFSADCEDVATPIMGTITFTVALDGALDGSFSGSEMGMVRGDVGTDGFLTASINGENVDGCEFTGTIECGGMIAGTWRCSNFLTGNEWAYDCGGEWMATR